MRVDINSIVKSAKGLAKNAAGFVSKNKHALIEGGLAGALGVVLKDAVDEAEELKKVNAVLVDVIEELKDEDVEADSNIS